MGGGFHPPLEVILSWPKPNYDNPESEGRQVLVINVIFSFLSIVVVSLRLFTRIWIKRQPGLDDLLITFTMVGCRPSDAQASNSKKAHTSS
jgi:hypothetical protein